MKNPGVPLTAARWPSCWSGFHQGAVFAARQAGVELLRVQARLAGVLRQALEVQLGNIAEQPVVILPEFPLLAGAAGHLGGLPQPPGVVLQDLLAAGLPELRFHLRRWAGRSETRR
jgi:hypothetical protein